MNLNESTLKKFITKIVNESLNPIEEAQKGKQFDLYLKMELNKLTPDVPEGKFDNLNIMEEVKKQLSIKIGSVLMKNFDYQNFYIIKLGSFVIKTNEGKEQIAFKKQGVENKLFSYPYLYIYHDKAEVIRFGSRFFETDDLILKAAQEYIKNMGINLVTKTETGKVIVINDFDKENLIDVMDYSKIQRPAAPKRDLSPKIKNNYVAGQPFVSNKFGKGKITKTKKFGVDEKGNTIYNVSVDFGGKEKTFRVPVKGNESSPNFQ